MPSQLPLIRLDQQAEELRLEWRQRIGANSGNLLGGVGGTHPDNRIVVPQTKNEFGETPGVLPDKFYNFI